MIMWDVFQEVPLRLDGKQLFMYTSVRKEAQPDGGVRDIQTQSLAVGDGMDYEKDVRNPILTAEDMPENSSPFDFRDPKMWKCEDGTYRCVIVNDRADGTGGRILLYRSEKMGLTGRLNP